jgi:hypothetical protein
VTEVLEDEPTRPRHLTWLVVAVLVLGLAVVAVDDRRVHGAESARVDVCATATATAWTLADRRVSGMASYVRPAFDGAYTPGVRTGLAQLVAGAALRAVPGLHASRSTCTGVDVRRWHGDLRRRLEDCLATLDARLLWLQEVARDGGVAFRSVPEPAAGCTA